MLWLVVVGLERHTLSAIGTQDRFLLEERFVLLPNPFNPPTRVCLIRRVEQNHELAPLLDDDPTGISELPKSRDHRQAIRKARRNVLREELLKFFLGHLTIGLGEPKKQFGPEKRIADLAAEALIIARVESGDEEVGTDKDQEEYAADTPSVHGFLQLYALGITMVFD